MGAVAFNTHELIKNLEKAGMSEEQAEAISTGILRAHEVAGLATKADLRESQVQTKANVQELRAEMKADLQELRAEMKADLQELRAEMKAVVQELRTEIQELRAETKADLRELELRMTIKLGSMMIVAVGVIGVMIKFL